jgi:hypothetical protein
MLKQNEEKTSLYSLALLGVVVALYTPETSVYALPRSGE